MNFFWDNIFARSDEKKSIHRILKNNILFKDLNPLEIHLLEKIVNVRRYKNGEAVFTQGEIGVGMYIIVTGKVGIYVNKSASGDHKNRNHVTTLHHNDFFGELALIELDGRRTATAIADDDSTLIGFFKPDLMELLDRNPRAGVKILLRLGEVLGTRLHQTTAMITSMRKENDV